MYIIIIKYKQIRDVILFFHLSYFIINHSLVYNNKNEFDQNQFELFIMD